MKRTWVFLLVLVPSQVITAQVLSTRLSGMGFVSVAVPDVETEAFLNPARALRIERTLLRTTPLYLRSTEDFESSSLVQFPPSFHHEDLSSYGFLLPVEVLIPFRSFTIGGSLSYRSGNWGYGWHQAVNTTSSPSQPTASNY